MKTAGTLGLATAAGFPLTTGSAAALEVDEPAQWTESDVDQIELTDDNTAPVVDHEPDQISEDRLVWDTWPLRNRDGSMAQFNGWQIIFSLTADPGRPEIDTPGDRHNWARISYFYSRDGKSWQEGGLVFEDEDWYGNQQWAGMAIYDEEEDQIYHFYTASEEIDPERFPRIQQEPPGQRLALAKGQTVDAGPNGVELVGENDHHIIGEADGEMYETVHQSSGIIFAFRDPWYFQHPETGEDLLLFEGNTPTPGYDDPNHPKNFNGNIGAMRATNDDLTEWELLPPVLESVGVNQQLERPHFVFQGGNWYLFTITHEFTYAPGLSGPEALHGWVSDSMYGDYEPLNESSLVVANPTEAPLQAYSWDTMQHGSNAVAQSFLNWQGVESDAELDQMSDQELMDAFGGTLAPSLQINLDGDETRIVTEKADGYVPPSTGRGGGQGRQQ
ncbi:glycoside hydrolase 68 family protein [Natronococcus pandeyae]|uniref:Glycoside hydrolase 68 family protein n=1 Tax=Natronococcus pandeyae TaxID=2055836 RepID=A0A8J8Q560_9EURY|nr:glycoside hydrolase family 68 protein [Natronococcus pandeyae]TYL37799.1 glycoside hydrolase 68 family protein [Natronococcus pandeyae]